MNAPKRSRARVLTPEGLQKLREQMRSHEVEENAGFKYTLERLGELTGLDPETVKNVLDCKGSDKRTIARCFENFGLTLNDSDHIPATQTTAIADPNFVGRDEAIADLSTLVSRNARVIVIQARGGVGKTTLARKYLQQAFGSFLEFPIAKETKDIASIEGLLEEKLRQLGEEPGREFLVSLDRLKRKLQAERLGILIDNLEPALDSAGKFIEAHRRYVELLRVLSDPTVQSLTLITSRERLREADVTVQHYSLRSLDVQAWEQFFQSRSINTDTPALATLHDAYGGNAKAMDIISGAVLEDFSGDVEAYWQANQNDLFIERDLEDLVAKQFDRLQELDPDAYKLLCRMGCYRYQDVPTVPIEGLFCLLWDVPENRHRRVIKALQDRSLVDFEGGDFWLHPVIRAEAIELLRVNQDWETANQKAVGFWTEDIRKIQTLKDAFRAFEACHHYVEISEFDLAADVLLRQRNTSSIGSSLINSFTRFGLLQQLNLILNQMIDHVKSKQTLCNLRDRLGELYWRMGYIREAIECHKIAKELANNLRLEYIEARSLFGISVCKIALGENAEALQLYREINARYETSQHDYAVVSWFSIAYLNSLFGFANESLHFAEKAYAETFSDKFQVENFQPPVMGLEVRLSILGSTYRNLGNYEKSLAMYEQAMSYIQSSPYSQVEAKCRIGLAEVYRDKEDFESATLLHLKAIKVLELIGARHDLAEAYYSLGLTYQAMGEVEKSRSNFQEAIRLFSEMEAPKQVERVRQSMQIPFRETLRCLQNKKSNGGKK